MKKTTIIILICSAIVLGMICGIIFSILDDKKLEEAQINEIRKVNEMIENNELENTDEIIATNQSDVKLSPNATICFEKHYNECGHTIIQKEQIEDDEVNKDEEYFKTLYKEFEGTCEQHYLITVKDDYIAVYIIDDDGNTVLKEVTDIPTQYLPEEDVKLLEQGITANGENELAKKLEDYE